MLDFFNYKIANLLETAVNNYPLLATEKTLAEIDSLFQPCLPKNRESLETVLTKVRDFLKIKKPTNSTTKVEIKASSTTTSEFVKKVKSCLETGFFVYFY